MIKLLHLPRLPAPVWALIGFVVLCFSISSDSIDLDEAQTWSYVRLATAGELITALGSDSNAETQTPLWITASWLWTKAFGDGEVAMRSINLFWAAIALAALAGVGRRLSLAWLPLFFAIQPFVWYAMDSARPPVMQMAGGALLLLATITALKERGESLTAIWQLSLGTLLLCGSNLFGLIPLASIVIGLGMHGIWKNVPKRGFGRPLLAATGLIALALVVFYVVRLSGGVFGYALWRLTPANLLFTAYEFLGFQGLGPGRQLIRAILKGYADVTQALPFLPILLCFTVAYAVVIGAAFKSWLTREASSPRPCDFQLRVWLMTVGVTLQSVLLLFVFAALVGMPFWGRHLAGVFPFAMLSVAIALHWAHQGLWRRPGRTGVLAVVLLLLCSTVMLRNMPIHRHDDYRAAVAEATRLAGTSHAVWWVADPVTALYYGIEVSRSPTPRHGQISHASNLEILPAELPDAIVLSRPDNFDRTAVVRNLIRDQDYSLLRRLQAFDIWVRTHDHPSTTSH